MYIEIVKCTDPKAWYRDQIGKFYHVDPVYKSGNFIVLDKITQFEVENYHYIKKIDCEEVPFSK